MDESEKYEEDPAHLSAIIIIRRHPKLLLIVKRKACLLEPVREKVLLDCGKKDVLPYG